MKHSPRRLACGHSLMSKRRFEGEQTVQGEATVSLEFNG